MVIHSWEVRLGEEGVEADASLLVLQKYRGVKHASGCCKVATNSSEEIECFSQYRQRFYPHRLLLR